jgi:hypothetical protein
VPRLHRKLGLANNYSTLVFCSQQHAELFPRPETSTTIHSLHRHHNSKEVIMTTKAIVFVALTFFVSSCNWFSPPKPTGTLVGSARLIIASGGFSANHSGIKVTASTEGTEISTTTEMSGRWQLQNVPSGTYVLSFEKSGYGTYKVPAYVFAAPGKARATDAILYPLPQHDVTSIAVTLQQDQIVVVGTVSGTGSRGFLLFFGLSQTVSANPSDYVYSFFGVTHANAFIAQVPFTSITNAGAPAGATISVIAYGTSNNTYYLDVETGRQVFYNLSATHSNTASFAVQ